MLKMTLLLTILSFLSPAEQKPGEPRNAALRYWAAWSMITPETVAKVDAVEWKGLEKETDPARLPAGFREAAAAIDASVVKALVEASAVRHCDFEIEWEKGFAAVLPHLGKARQAARLLRVDARAKLAHGDVHGAAEDVAATYRLSAHLAGDQIIISALVSMAIARLADGEAELLAASGRLTAADRDAILAAMAVAEPADPFGVRRGVVMEQRVASDWIKNNFRGPDAGKRLTPYVAMGEGNAAGVRKISGMSGDELGREVDRYNQVFEDILGAWDAPDAAARLAQVEKKLESGGYGVLGSILAPALGKAHANDVKNKAERARITEALRAAKTGG